jgi:transcriptional regulator with XRE-family HTH domain
MTFAERLRELRDAKGLSEARLATASGVSLASVHEYGLGRRKPSFEAVVKIARALGVTCQAFEGCVDIPADAVPGAEAQKGRPSGEKPKGRQKRSGAKRKGKGEESTS